MPSAVVVDRESGVGWQMPDQDVQQAQSQLRWPAVGAPQITKVDPMEATQVRLDRVALRLQQLEQADYFPAEPSPVALLKSSITSDAASIGVLPSACARVVNHRNRRSPSRPLTIIRRFF